MSTRIDRTFAALAAKHQPALIGYLTAGDPDWESSRNIALAACRAGLDLLELGVPFSDPTSDGPAIQAAAQRALRRGATVSRTLELAAEIRRGCDTPLVLFGYFNPILRFGPEAFCATAAAAGADGLLVVDLPPEEASELQPHADRHGLPLIRLVAPTTPLARMRKLASGAGGFLYLITRTGVTGGGQLDRDAIAHQAAALKGCTTRPVCLGFGISTPADARALAGLADGVVVGSALVRAAAEGAESGDAAARVAQQVRDFRQAVGTSH